MTSVTSSTGLQTTSAGSSVMRMWIASHRTAMRKGRVIPRCRLGRWQLVAEREQSALERCSGVGASCTSVPPLSTTCHHEGRGIGVTRQLASAGVATMSSTRGPALPSGSQ